MHEVEFVLNGERVGVDPAGTALTAIRDRLGLTGTKMVCGSGGCGACTVLVNGKPVEACVTPVSALAGTDVTTIEGLAADGNMTPVQRAMTATDAVQCGFCTPGVVMSAEAFVRSWRDEHGTERPRPTEITAALDGVLCRCGSYPGIVAAVAGACAGDYDEPGPTPAARIDAVDKVTGSAQFTVDVAGEGTLIGRILRSTVPRAEIGEIDTSAAEQLTGVHAVVDLLDDDRKVRYLGQPIAAVAATSAEIAERALERIDVTYRILPAVIGMDAARDPSSPDLIDGRLFVPSSYEAGLTAATVPRKHNMRGPMSLFAARRFTARRRVEAARRRRDPLLVEGTWLASGQSHAAPEPHSAVARWEGDDLIVHTSTQSVAATAHKLDRRFDAESVRVIAEHVGGAFGAKQGLPEPVVAAVRLARIARAPVRMALSPADELAYGGYRPGGRIDLALLGAVDGSFSALVATGFHDGGDSAGQTVVGLMRLSYPGFPMALSDYDVLSNGVPAKPFQAPGSPFALFALEGAIDELARRLGRDPIELRRSPKSRSSRLRLYDWAGNHPLWLDRRPSDDRVLRGVGVAFGSWHYAFDPGTRVRVTVESNGLTVETATQDTGTGSRQTLASVVADVFGVTTDQVRTVIGDSRLPPGPTSSASRTTPSLAPTAEAAAQELRDTVLEQLATDMPGVVAAQGGVDHAGEHIPWHELWHRLAGAETTAQRPADRRPAVLPVAIEGVKFGWGLSDAAHIAEVEIDRASGATRVSRMAVALDAGRIHTPVQARSQVHGALARGIGQALYETRRVDPVTGAVISDSYERYRIMRMSEMPEVDITFFEDGFEHAAGGGAGIAELAITSIPAAVANAVADATGVHPRCLPIVPTLEQRGGER